MVEQTAIAAAIYKGWWRVTAAKYPGATLTPFSDLTIFEQNEWRAIAAAAESLGARLAVEEEPE